jgi:predicted nucleic acid-binding protein
MGRASLFFDTSAWVALNEANDPHHAEAVDFMNEVRSGERPYAWAHTSELVLQETYTFLAYNYGVPSAHRVLERIRGASVTIHSLGDVPFEEVLARAERFEGPKPLSFVDWSVVVALERLPSAHLFTFDAGFARHGVTVVPQSAGRQHA